jgi:hypothetical protein
MNTFDEFEQLLREALADLCNGPHFTLNYAESTSLGNVWVCDTCGQHILASTTVSLWTFTHYKPGREPVQVPCEPVQVPEAFYRAWEGEAP